MKKQKKKCLLYKNSRINRDTIQKVLSTLYGDACAQFFQFSSNYYLEPIGLPEGFTFEDRNFAPFGYEATRRSGECNVGVANVHTLPIMIILEASSVGFQRSPSCNLSIFQ